MAMTFWFAWKTRWFVNCMNKRKEHVHPYSAIWIVSQLLYCCEIKRLDLLNSKYGWPERTSCFQNSKSCHLYKSSLAHHHAMQTIF